MVWVQILIFPISDLSYLVIHFELQFMKRINFYKFTYKVRLKY
jgi:hypothetical protein